MLLPRNLELVVIHVTVVPVSSALLILLLLPVLLFFSFLADPFSIALDTGFHQFSVADLRVVAVEDGPERQEGGQPHDDSWSTSRKETERPSGISTDH